MQGFVVLNEDSLFKRRDIYTKLQYAGEHRGVKQCKSFVFVSHIKKYKIKGTKIGQSDLLWNQIVLVLQ